VVLSKRCSAKAVKQKLFKTIALGVAKRIRTELFCTSPLPLSAARNPYVPERLLIALFFSHLLNMGV
jgi:hypothetical protein